jgi:hypothetical protein
MGRKKDSLKTIGMYKHGSILIVTKPKKVSFLIFK